MRKRKSYLVVAPDGSEHNYHRPSTECRRDLDHPSLSEWAKRMAVK